MVWAASPAQRLMGDRGAVHHQGYGDRAIHRPGISPYAPRFAQGATVVPRVLFMVQSRPSSTLGTGAGRTAVRSQRSTTEKRPWSELDPLDNVVENGFIRPIYLGDNVLPFRLLATRSGVIPWDGKKLLDGSDDQIDDYPGLASWWRKAEQAWDANRSSDRMTLRERLDYRRGLSHQFPAPTHRVVYSKGGMYLAAARVSDQTAVIDHKLYWAAASTIGEAHYLSRSSTATSSRNWSGPSRPAASITLATSTSTSSACRSRCTTQAIPSTGNWPS